MSSDDEDITRIEDLPDFNPEEEDEDFASLEDMASDMGLEVEELEEKTQSELSTDSLMDSDDSDSPPEFTSEFSNPIQDEETSADQNEDWGNADWEDDFNSNEFNESTDSIEPVSLPPLESDDDSPPNFNNFGSDFEPEAEPEAEFDSLPDSEFESELDEEIEAVSETEEETEPEAEFESASEPVSEPEKMPELEPVLASDQESQEPKEDPIERIRARMTELSELKTTIEEEKEPVIKTEISREEPTTYKEPEDLNEVKDFARSHAIMDYPAEGNPPFSIIIKNLKYYEDVETVLQILADHKLSEDPESDKQKLINGQMLIPRLSEYVAILICHKLRLIDCDLLMGLTEELHPAKSYKSDDRGLMTKHGLKRNRKHHYTVSDLIDNKTIMATTLNLIDGYSVVEHLGIVTETKNLSSDELRAGRIEEEIISQMPSEEAARVQNSRISYENTLASKSQTLDFSHITKANASKPQHFHLDSIYRDMVEELKTKAVDKKANAVVGINFTITPVSLETYLHTGPEYQLLCTGNLVWLEKN